MRAVVCPRLGTPADLVIEDMPEPQAGPGEIQVAVHAAGVNFVDVLMIAGQYQHKPDPPFVPGMEAAGVVRAVGAGVSRFRVGDRVMTSHRPGAFAEVVVVREDKAYPVPAGLDDAEAAAFRSAYHTAYHSLVQRAGLQPGETVLVHGATGGVGLAAVQVGKQLGAMVIATGGSDAKLVVVAKQGADHVVNYSAGFRDAVKALTGGRGVDVVYDPVGGDVFDESMRCIDWGARILVIGFTGGRAAVVRTNHVLIKGASILGVRAGEAGRKNPKLIKESMQTISDWAARGLVRPHLSHRFPFERVRDALQAVVDRQVVGKAVLIFGS
jgi:NADPH2:quinone reductase